MSTPTSAGKPLIVVVDDFKPIRDSFARILLEAGYEVVQAASAEECLAMIAELNPSLALLDMSLPGMSGFELARRLRSNESTRETPVIFLTAHGNEIQSAIPSSISFQGMLTKPCMPDALLAAIQNVLRPEPPLKTKTAESNV